MKALALLLLALAPAGWAAPAPGPAPGDLLGCLDAALPAEGKVVAPDDPAWLDATTMSMGYTANPAAVVYAYDTSDVVAAVDCARAAGVRVSVAGRRHSYMGLSIVDGALAIDMSNLTSVEVDTRAQTVTAGAGHTNGLLMASVAKVAPGFATLIGSCPSVGIIGFVLGGGQGGISPWVGLGADQLLSLEMVLANGTVVEVNRTSHPELLWASKGGGGGLGVITRVTLKIHELPDPDHVSIVRYQSRPERAVDAVLAFQDWLPTADRRYGGGASLKPDGFVTKLFFLGNWSEGVAGLQDSGLLDPDVLTTSPLPGPPSADGSGRVLPPGSVPAGAAVLEFNSYAHAMAYGICGDYLTVFGGKTCPFLPGVPCTSSGVNCTDPAALDALVELLADSRSALNVGTSDLWQMVSYVTTGGRLVKELPREAWQAVNDVLAMRAKDCKTGAGFVVGLHHLVNGAANDVAPDATAVPWRNASISLTEDSPISKLGTFAAVKGLSNAGDVITGLSDACAAVGTAFVDALAPYLPGGPDSRLYLNYLRTQPASEYDWQEGYYGDNYPRLQAVRAAYDPSGLFSKPLVPESPADLEAPVGYTPARPLWETLLSATTPASAPAPSAPAAAAAGPTSAAATRASTLPAVVLAVVAALLQLLA